MTHSSEGFSHFFQASFTCGLKKVAPASVAERVTYIYTSVSSILSGFVYPTRWGPGVQARETGT